MARSILVVDAHPHDGSLCSALADAYSRGARVGGHQVRFSRLRYHVFDTVSRSPDAPLEPDLAADRERIAWCEHVTIVTPTWWSSVPALLKGWIDRVLELEIALGERSARVVYTHDDEHWLGSRRRDDLLWKVMKRGVLAPAGFAPVRRTELGSVSGSSPEQRAGWIDKLERLGEKGR